MVQSHSGADYWLFAINLAYTHSSVIVNIPRDMYDPAWDKLSVTLHEAPMVHLLFYS